MPKVCTTVNLFDKNRRRVTLYAGDEIPDWALARITNPKAIAGKHVPAVESVESEPVGSGEDAGSGCGDYSALKNAELAALLAERGLDPKGNKADMVARLKESDNAPEVDDVDPFALTLDELKKLAEDRGIDIGEASTDVEIATIIQQAGE